MGDENIIKVKDFVDKYDKLTSSKAKTSYLSSVKKREYMPYIEKMLWSDLIIKNSCFDKEGNLHVDSRKKFIFYVDSILRAYTYLEFDKDDIWNDFDLLAERGLIDEIINTISKKDIHDFELVLKMTYNDIFTNNYEIHAYVEKKLNDIYPLISSGIDAIFNIVNNMDNSN